MRRTWIVFSTTLILGWWGSSSIAFSAPALEPDIIYHNGKIITGNDDFDIVEALAVADGKIVALGSAENVKDLAGPHTQLVDLAGKTVLPGFYDSHVHIRMGRGPDIQDWTHINTREGLFEAIRARADQLKENEWIRAVLKNEDWPQHKLPTRWDIDQVIRDQPVVLTRGAHVMVVNSLGLEKAGITRATPDPPSGTIVRDERGLLTGWLREGAAWRLVWKVVPESLPDDETTRSSIRSQLESLLSVGITSLNVAGIRPRQLHWIQEVYDAWGERLPRMTVQVRLSPGYDQNDSLEEGVERAIEELEGLGFHTGFGSSRLKLGAVKMSIDGGLSGEAFWSSKPYPGRPDFSGLIRIPQKAFYEVARRAHDLGWQLGIHAIGDAAVVMVVDSLEKILEENPRENHRHYLHHVSVLPPEETLQKMGRLDLAVSSQPNFIHSLGAFAANSLRDDQLARNNPQRSLTRHGIRLGYGSDGMPYDPLFGIWTAVTRTGHDGKIYGADERVPLKDAIRYYTLGTAYLNFDDQQRGSLEVGKVADMVVLSEDILSVEPNRIRDIEIVKTIIGGEVLYPKVSGGR